MSILMLIFGADPEPNPNNIDVMLKKTRTQISILLGNRLFFQVFPVFGRQTLETETVVVERNISACWFPLDVSKGSWACLGRTRFVTGLQERASCVSWGQQRSVCVPRDTICSADCCSIKVCCGFASVLSSLKMTCPLRSKLWSCSELEKGFDNLTIEEWEKAVTEDKKPQNPTRKDLERRAQDSPRPRSDPKDVIKSKG